MEEIWKDIEGYEGLYQVSNFGRVKSLDRVVFSKRWGGLYMHIKEFIMLPQKTQTGYLRLELYKEGKSKKHKVHRLVAQAFIPNPENKPQVDHINGLKTDNRAENLRWSTAEENRANPNTLIKFCKKYIPVSA